MLNGPTDPANTEFSFTNTLLFVGIGAAVTTLYSMYQNRMSNDDKNDDLQDTMSAFLGKKRHHKHPK